MLSDSWTDCVAHLVSCTQYPFRFGECQPSNGEMANARCWAKEGVVFRVRIFCIWACRCCSQLLWLPLERLSHREVLTSTLKLRSYSV